MAAVREDGNVAFLDEVYGPDRRVEECRSVFRRVEAGLVATVDEVSGRLDPLEDLIWHKLQALALELVGGVGGGTTLMLTVAGGESNAPSFTLNVNASSPKKPAAGL